MKRIFLLLLYIIFCCLLFSFTSRAQKPDSVQKFIDSALTIMQHHSMFSTNVNWKKVRDRVAILSKDAQTYKETKPALQYAFNCLDDKHGWLVIDDVDYHNTQIVAPSSRVNENMKQAALKGPVVYATTIQKKYAYLSIPFFGGQTNAGCNAFAQRLQDSLCKVVNAATKGIIIDLRLNAGGNIFAMLVGVSNVFGNQAPKGQFYVGDWQIKDYGVSLNDTFRIQLKKNCGDYSKVPVAILIGPVTASAGEFLALGFSSRKNTILIGERTAGYTSGNNGFLLPGVNNGIVVAEDYAKDKKGRIYTDGIDPFIRVLGGDDFFHHATDKKIKAAINWLNAKAR